MMQGAYSGIDGDRGWLFSPSLLVTATYYFRFSKKLKATSGNMICVKTSSSLR